MCGSVRGLEAWVDAARPSGAETKDTSSSGGGSGGGSNNDDDGDDDGDDFRRAGGRWVSVEAEADICRARGDDDEPSVLVVMAGSKLEELTDGRCRRLWHRVVRDAALPERTSVAFMLDAS
jgi:hypothetical protein